MEHSSCFIKGRWYSIVVKGKSLGNFSGQGNLLSLEISTLKPVWKLPFPHIKKGTYTLLRERKVGTLELHH